MTPPTKRPASKHRGSKTNTARLRPAKMVVHPIPEPKPYSSEGWLDEARADKPQQPNYWGAFWIACACAAGLLGVYIAEVAR